MAAFIKEATSRNNVQLLWISFSLAFKITNTIYRPKTIYHEFYELVPSPHFSVSLHKRHSYSGNQGSERASHCPRPPAEGPGRTRTQAGLVWSPRSRIKSLPTTPLCHVSPLSALFHQIWDAINGSQWRTTLPITAIKHHRLEGTSQFQKY